MPPSPSSKASFSPSSPTTTLERAFLYQASLCASLDADEHGPTLADHHPPPAYTPYDEATPRAEERRQVDQSISAGRLSAPRAVQVRAAPVELSGTRTATMTSGLGGSGRKTREERLKTTVGRMMVGRQAGAEDYNSSQASGEVDMKWTGRLGR